MDSDFVRVQFEMAQKGTLNKAFSFSALLNRVRDAA